MSGSLGDNIAIAQSIINEIGETTEVLHQIISHLEDVIPPSDSLTREVEGVIEIVSGISGQGSQSLTLATEVLVEDVGLVQAELNSMVDIKDKLFDSGVELLRSAIEELEEFITIESI